MKKSGITRREFLIGGAAASFPGASRFPCALAHSKAASRDCS